ncbi:MAG TPA: M1 family aminopeptidase [Thermoanaerobaculia bacterium]|nr:M1 family aminopeptidase [Thermoanaerobaculia bacterium]HUM28734.1 M1 family aminopeptidase [Thermoanaerobaculia bacterium]HXK68016.1 M1 family aminopeptidase [Thermoanaerobaculia bacterium]
MKRVLALLALVALPLWGATFEEQLKTFRSPILGSEAFMLKNYTHTWGNTDFAFTGKVAPLTLQDKTVGFAFSGEGTIAMHVQKGPFRLGNVTNLTESHQIKLEEGDVLTDTFKDAVFLANRIPEDLFSGDKADMAGLKDIVSKSLERWDKTPYQGMDHFFAHILLNEYDGLSLIATFEGGRKDAFYQVDEVSEKSEFYGYWKKSSVYDLYYLDSLVSQPFNFDIRKRPEYPYYQTDIDLEIVSEDNTFVREKTKTRITSNSSGLKVIGLSLINGKDRSYKPWNEYGDPFTVTRVTGEDGKPLAFSHRYNELLVELPKALNKKESVTLTIEAEGNLLKNYEGDSYLVLGNFDYFPQLDTTWTKAPFHAVIKVKDPYISLGTGKNIKRWKEGELNCLETREERPISFPFLVAGKFDVTEKSEKDYDVKVYSYVMGKQKAGKKLAKNGLAILDFYSSGMALFPYHELEVVEIPYQRHFFWQAPSGVVEITSEAFNPLGGSEDDYDTILRRLFSLGQNARYAHEIAHQWFGNLVGFETEYDNWISESFAEYLSYMFMKSIDKKKAESQYQIWVNSTKECGDKGTVYGAASAGEYYTCLLYGKGPFVLDALRAEIGDEAFNTVLNLITNAAAKKNMGAITEDLILIVNHVTKKDFRPFFDKYIFGEENPEVKS